MTIGGTNRATKFLQRNKRNLMIGGLLLQLVWAA